jgi:t-SNARE complex subunit (syntaxin)
MNFKVDEKTKIENVDTYGKKEIKRVEEAIEDATKRLYDLQSKVIHTKDNALKINELKGAISIGTLYLTKLKNKWGY